MLNIPILGMVENMSHHVCKSCGHREHTFGEGGVRKAALEYNVDLLGEVSGGGVIHTRHTEYVPNEMNMQTQYFSYMYYAPAYIWHYMVLIRSIFIGSGPFGC